MISMSSYSFDLDSYLIRVGLEARREDLKPDLDILAQIQLAHVQHIPFENLDVVQRRTISIDPADLERKIVAGRRGGYCFETNAVLAMALRSMGYEVHAMVARVRYMRPPSPLTTFTHVVLIVTIAGTGYLVDVGFGGMAPLSPIRVAEEGPQETLDGTYKIVDNRNGYFTLLWLLADNWVELFMWKNEIIPEADLALSNWWSCTHPSARWVGCLFAARVVGDERHHVLNGEYCVRRKDGSSVKTHVSGREALLELLRGVFGIDLKSDGAAFDDNIDRFLTPIAYGTTL